MRHLLLDALDANQGSSSPAERHLLESILTMLDTNLHVINAESSNTFGESTETKTGQLSGKLEHVSNEKLRLSILYRVRCTILLFGICLTTAFINIGYNLFSIRTPRARKHAKELKDKRFELENLTHAVDANSSPVNEQVEISLFCTRHLVGSLLKMLESFVSVLPCDWFSLSGFCSLWFL